MLESPLLLDTGIDSSSRSRLLTGSRTEFSEGPREFDEGGLKFLTT